LSRPRIAALIVAGLLAGCGFQPMYAERNATVFDGDMAAVEVGLIQERTGQLVRDALIDGIDRKGRAATARRYQLDVEVAEAIRTVAVQRDTVSTRANLTLTANYRLVDAKTGELLFRGSARTISAYDISTEPFAEQTSADDARRTGSRDLATGILIQVSVYFSGVAAGQEPAPVTP